MRLLFTGLLLTIPCLSNGQQEAKSYHSAADYVAHTEEQLPDVYIRKTRLSEKEEYVYHIASTNKKAHKNITRDCWALERNDSLFVNCNKIFKTKETNKGLPLDRKVTFYANAFAHILFRSEKYLYFRAGRTNTFGILPPFRNRESAGAIGDGLNTAMAASDDQLRFHYLYDIKADKVIYFNRGIMRNYVKQLTAPEDAAFVKYVTQLIAEER